MSTGWTKFPGRGNTLNPTESRVNRGVPGRDSAVDRRAAGKNPVVDRRNLGKDSAVGRRHAGTDFTADERNARKGSSKQPEGAFKQTIFQGASGIKITGGRISITGPVQPRGSGSTDGLTDRGKAGDDHSTDGAVAPYATQSMFDNSSDVNTYGGHFIITGHPPNAGGRIDDGPAPLPVNQSMFQESKDVTTEDSVFDIVAGSRSTSSHKGDGSEIGEAGILAQHHVPGGDMKDTNLKNTAKREQGTSAKPLPQKYPEKRYNPTWRP